MHTRRSGLKPAAAAAVLLCASTPAQWFPGAEWLVLPGLMAWYCLCTSARRPRRWSWLLGVVHMLVFTWSVRHFAPTPLLGTVLVLAIALVGGLYYALAAEVTVRLRRLPGPLVFGLAVALACWLRAAMPEIPYPHGQPCHSLWQHPWALGAVRWGGEPLANGLLAALAAALWDLARSWQLAVPPWRAAWFRVAVALALLLFTCAVRPPQPERVEPGSPVRIAAVEPDLGPDFQRRDDWRQVVRERLVQPTLAVAGRNVEGEVPDLVLWPESTHPGILLPDRAGLRFDHRDTGPLRLRTGVRLLISVERLHEVDGQSTPAAVLVDDNGRFVAHQEKLVLVPAGEYLPFVGWLPDSWRKAIEDWVRGTDGVVPASVPGTVLPPLRTTAGVPFGALHCYDNAFPGPARAQVEQGARLLCVLSNEAWYRGGSELDQLVAQTVIRALETSTPIVRCTVDGWSLAIDGEGSVMAELPRAVAPRQGPRVLQVFIPPGPGRLGPMAWLPPAVVWAMLSAIACGLLHAVMAWARLPSLRPSRNSGPGAVPGPVADSGGS